MADPDYYAVLGVDDRANADEIKRAFRRLTLEFHPDRHAGDVGAEERYRLINIAYETLSDTSSRTRYDAARRLSQLDLTRGFDGKSARDLLGNVFGDVFGTRRNQRRRGRDLKYTLTVDLAQAVLGSTHSIEFEAPGPCPTCKGSGTRPGGKSPETCPLCAGRGEVKGEGLFARRTRCGRCDGTGMIQIDACETCRGAGTKRAQRAFEVKLPPGITPGAERVIAGQGEPGRFGGDPGDLRITVNVRPHERLVRDGDDMRCDVAVSITEAALGSRVSVPTVDGDVEVEVPAGIKSGTRLRLRGKGVPKVDARGRATGPRGDQLIGVVVETPSVAASSRVRALLTELEIECARAGALPRRESERRGTGIGSGAGTGTGTGTGTGPR
ncbi:MAG TPA: J domain-containing protein [Nannocystaceae bacterium]|nr:J domain-containing protein [Nannocystaceae bacterium]